VLRGEPALTYARAAADALHQPQLYIDAVLGARPVSRDLAAGAVERVAR
jgi:multicomponent K+:H+ antiporter subunit D